LIHSFIHGFRSLRPSTVNKALPQKSPPAHHTRYSTEFQGNQHNITPTKTKVQGAVENSAIAGTYPYYQNNISQTFNIFKAQEHQMLQLLQTNLSTTTLTPIPKRRKTRDRPEEHTQNHKKKKES